MVVLLNYSSGNTDSDEVQLILQVWWNRDFYNRRRLYIQRLYFLKFQKEYRNFSDFVLLLDEYGLVTDSKITEYITADEESRKEIVRRLKEIVQKLKYSKIMP